MARCILSETLGQSKPIQLFFILYVSSVCNWRELQGSEASIAIAIAMLCAECELCIFTACPTQFQTEPLQRGAKYREWGKACNFRLTSAFILETVRDRPVVAMER